ncbi:MAG: hypothetical protein IIA61_01665 [Candidatus Marinimicrobia bacterium]|nr:hypothetical protein [Candidatus Neomarinimicrobiota bacterium]
MDSKNENTPKEVAPNNDNKIGPVQHKYAPNAVVILATIDPFKIIIPFN